MPGSVGALCLDWLATKANIPEKKVAAVFALPKDKRTAAQTKQLQDYYVRNVAAETKATRDTVAQLKQQLAAQKPPTVPIIDPSSRTSILALSKLGMEPLT